MKNKEKILITGAGGFIGGRLAEAIFYQNKYTPIAGINSWKGVAKISRYPIEIRKIDVLNRESILSGLKDISYIIHCAYGDRSVTVDGTSNILKVASDENIKQFIHISTVSVYSDEIINITESSQTNYSDDEYGNMKIDAEKECLIARKFPLPVTIIRPAIVYGPYSKLWTYNIYNRLVNDFKISGNVTAGICNLIYIDDLVQLILLTIGNKNALNMEFNAVGDDNITWEEYFKIFRKEIEAYQDIKRHNKLRINPKVLSAIKSPFMKLAIYLVGNHGKTVFYFYERFEFLRPLFLFLENRLKSSPARHELQLFSDYRRISNKSAKTKLGFSPAFDISRGIKISMQWLARFR